MAEVIIKPDMFQQYVAIFRGVQLEQATLNYVGFEVLTAVVMKSMIFWDITPCRWRRYVPPKSRLTFNGLHGVISQKMVFFSFTLVLHELLNILI
jgi:hypothetical protein